MSMEKNDRLQLSVQNHTADVLDLYMDIKNAFLFLQHSPMTKFIHGCKNGTDSP